MEKRKIFKLRCRDCGYVKSFTARPAPCKKCKGKVWRLVKEERVCLRVGEREEAGGAAAVLRRRF